MVGIEPVMSQPETQLTTTALSVHDNLYSQVILAIKNKKSKNLLQPDRNRTRSITLEKYHTVTALFMVYNGYRSTSHPI